MTQATNTKAIMRKIMQWMLVATLICGATVFTSCKSDDDDKDPVIENLSEKIIGKWIVADRNGQPMPTNGKIVFTFVSSTKAYVSVAHSLEKEGDTEWLDQMEADVSIRGNKVTLTMHPDEHTTILNEFHLTAINNNEFTANCKITRTVDGNVVHSKEDIIRYERITADYSEAILGLWECESISGGETYNDANGRLEFMADGTYNFYRKNDAGNWEAVTTRDFQNYFVDGKLVATRWKDKGEAEQREWWEVKSLKGNQMVWTALRQNADGSTFQQEVKWKKIDLKVAEKIIGKWIISDKDGLPMPTNRTNVFTFVSATKAYMSASLNARPELNPEWMDNIEANVTINGNLMTLTLYADEHNTSVHEFIVTDINATEFTANHKVTVTVDGNVMFVDEDVIRLTKVTADYRADIIGTWEGHCTSEGSVFDDGQEHRWQYNADGTYVYYVKDGDNWVPSENTLNEYFVDGSLLCMRWIDNEQDNREWWEINIDGDKMNWTALRQKEDGSTFTATFEMKKVE
jgi:hypothetical protein